MYTLADCIQGAVQLAIVGALVPFYMLCLLAELVSHCFSSRVKVPLPNAVLITGAGSGLGREFAIYYAKNGAKNLALLDLKQEALEETARLCAEHGASSEIHIADATNADRMKQVIEEYDAKHPLDLVLAIAGVAESTIGPGGMFDIERAGRIIPNVNMIGVVNTVLPAIAVMRPRGRGQIGLMSSMSGFLSYWPQAPTYAASKAFVKSYGLGLRAHFWKTGLRINVLAPYFINTPMVQAVAAEREMAKVRQIPIPGLMAPPAAVAHMADGLQRDKAVVTMPLAVVTLINIIHALPHAVTDVLMRNAVFYMPFWSHVYNDAEISPTPRLSAKPATPAAQNGTSNGAAAIATAITGEADAADEPASATKAKAASTPAAENHDGAPSSRNARRRHSIVHN